MSVLSKKKGKQLEIDFIKMYEDRYNCSLIRPTPQQDREQHWDFKLEDSSRVDLKSIKVDNPEEVYLEFVGDTGWPGWLFGKADYIMFEHVDDFYMIPRGELLSAALQLCQDDTTQGVPPKFNRPALYRTFGRPEQRKVDKCTKVLYKDIEHLITRRIPKSIKPVPKGPGLYVQLEGDYKRVQYNSLNKII